MEGSGQGRERLIGLAAAIAAWGALLMPLLGGLAAYLLYRLGRIIFDPLTGLAAALFLAFMPGAVSDTFLGRIDHHALVAPLTLGIFLSFLACVRSASGNRRLVWGILCGLLAIVSIADLANKPFDLYQPSLFITTPYLLAALLVHALLAGWRTLLAASGVLLALVVAAGFFASGWFGVAREALGVAGGENLSYMMAAEAIPLFSDHQAFNLNYAVHYFTYLVLLAPVFFLAFAWETFQKGNSPRPASSSASG